ncbi:hypothetical protein ACE3NQ_15080 [Paenibacillus terreus]|uniref:Uncharacterized protein n=1 Tax=Paenibacillus terreus TaxID=1387834 RepID=A0ABV5B970_9BACL
MSRYSEYVEKHVPRPPIVPTDWDYVCKEFDDIIDGDIIDGNKEGRDRYPQVRKMIRIKYGGGALHASEYIQDRRNVAPCVIQFEYDWQYDQGNPEASWKFHYDTYHPQHYWPATKHFHQHDQPNPLKTNHGRTSNFAARDVCAVLETIRVALRVSGKLP